jgi:rubrerythrin
VTDARRRAAGDATHDGDDAADARDDAADARNDAADTGGDPACWADRVCPACGLLDERAERDGRCRHCGATDDSPNA